MGYWGFFISVEDAQSYVNRILKSRFWRLRCGVREVRLEYRQVQYSEAEHNKHGPSAIVISQARLCEQFVLHELTHLVIKERFPDAADHGPEFCRMLLKMTRRYIGPMSTKLLKEQFAKNRVEF